MNANGVANARSNLTRPPCSSRQISRSTRGAFHWGSRPLIAGVIEHTQHEGQREVAVLVTGTKWIGDIHSGQSIELDNPALMSSFANQVVPTLRRGRTTGDREPRPNHPEHLRPLRTGDRKP